MSMLVDLLDSYIANRKALNMSPRTLKTNISNVGMFIRWLRDKHGISKSEELRSAHMQEYQKHLSEKRTSRGHLLMPRSINKSVECVRTFIGCLGKDGYVPPRLHENIDYVKVPDLLPKSVLVHDQVQAMVGSVDEASPNGFRDRSILELMYSNGIRASELLGLEIGKIDFKSGTAIIMGKGMKERVVPIGKTALKYLETYITIVRPYVVKDPNEKAVFLNTNGHALTYVVLRRLVKIYAAKAGLPDHVTPHTLRRSCTTELLRGGAGMYHVKELLGHTSLDTLKHYARLTITDLRKTHEKCHPREREVAGEESEENNAG
jgi:integrase/recombinase XerD